MVITVFAIGGFLMGIRNGSTYLRVARGHFSDQQTETENPDRD
jgi:hypothetical protein